MRCKSRASVQSKNRLLAEVVKGKAQQGKRETDVEPLAPEVFESSLGWKWSILVRIKAYGESKPLSYYSINNCRSTKYSHMRGKKKSGFVNMEHYEIVFFRSIETGEASKARRMALFCPF